VDPLGATAGGVPAGCCLASGPVTTLAAFRGARGWVMRLRIGFAAVVVVFASVTPTVRAAAISVPPLTFVVNSLLNGGDNDTTDTICNSSSHGVTCTLRAAIDQANAHHETIGRDAIHFSIGSGEQTIKPLSALPAITDAVGLDATTQPASGGHGTCSAQLHHPCIELDGESAGGNANGLDVEAGGSLVRGLAINRFHFGILLAGKGGNRVEGNDVGTDRAGTTAEPNGVGIVDQVS